MTLKLPKFAGSDATMLALGIVALVVVYYVGKKVLTGAANVVGGAVSGNNAVTAGTPYAGYGVLGTLGAATNSASGGIFSNIGNDVGGWAADLFQSSPTPATTVDATGGSQ